MSAHAVTITGPQLDDGRFHVVCVCGWSHYVPAVVTAAVVWNQHAKEAT